MDKLGRYEILGEIAVGGMAEILLGRLVGPSGFERVVVVKRILPHLAKRPEFVSMFLDEARTVARLRHPNVVQVHELGEEAGELFLVMEYLEGESVAGLLRRLHARGEKLAPNLAMHVVAEACRGLHAAHEATDDGLPFDLVHRDVSPQNLFVTYAGEVKVIDFGIAKAADRTTRTEAGQVKGKFAYMSPEQCAGKAIDRRTDVFALGVVLWELCAGRQLFKRANEMATLKAINELPIPSLSSVEPGCPGALDDVVAHALERVRDERTASAADLRREILAITRGSGGDPEEELGTTMRRVFADRIEEKREMLSRARTAASVRIPEGEADAGVEVPILETAEPTSTVLLHAPPPVLPRSRRSAIAVVGGTTLLALAGWAALRTGTPTGADVTGADVTGADVTGADVTGASRPPRLSTSTALVTPELASSTSSAVDARPADIVLHVTSTPSGARVTIAGRDVGVTPVDARVAKGTAPLDVAVNRQGFAPFRQTVVPDVDQRIFTTLELTGRSQRPPTGKNERIEKLP